MAEGSGLGGEPDALRNGGVGLQDEAPAARPDDRSSILETHMVDGENHFP